MDSQQIARWIYERLPETDGANRYDNEWKRGRYSMRFYVGPMITKKVRGFNLWLGTDTFTSHTTWPANRISYSSDYIGPEPSTFDSSRIESNWQPKKSWYLKSPSKRNYGKWQWRLGYANGFFGKRCGWSFSYYDGHIEIWLRKPRKD